MVHLLLFWFEFFLYCVTNTRQLRRRQLALLLSSVVLLKRLYRYNLFYNIFNQIHPFCRFLIYQLALFQNALFYHAVCRLTWSHFEPTFESTCFREMMVCLVFFIYATIETFSVKEHITIHGSYVVVCEYFRFAFLNNYGFVLCGIASFLFCMLPPHMVLPSGSTMCLNLPHLLFLLCQFLLYHI